MTPGRVKGTTLRFAQIFAPDVWPDADVRYAVTRRFLISAALACCMVGAMLGFGAGAAARWMDRNL